MIIFENGEYREATPGEIAELEALLVAAPTLEPTPGEKLAALLTAIEGGLSDA